MQPSKSSTIKVNPENWELCLQELCTWQCEYKDKVLIKIDDILANPHYCHEQDDDSCFMTRECELKPGMRCELEVVKDLTLSINN